MDLVHFSDDRGVVVIDDDQRVLGVLTEGDIMRAIRRGVLHETRVGQVMQVNPRLSGSPLSPREFAREFAEEGTLIIPIVDDDRKLIDVQRARDCIQELLSDGGS